MAGNSNVHTPGTARVTRSSIKDHLSVQKSGLVPTTPLLAAKRRIAATDTKKARNDVDSSPVLGREPRKRPRLSLGSDLTVGHGVSADEFRPKGINLEKSLIEARSENVADTDAVVNIADAVPLPRESPDLALPVIRKQAEEVTPDKLKKISITTPNIQDAKKLDSKLQLRDLKAPALSSSAITIHSKRSFDDFVSSDVYLTHVKTKTAEITSLDTTSKTHIFSAPLRPINQPAYKKYQSLVLSGPNLPLPTHYELLERFFVALEYTICFLRNRDQAGVFERFRKPVENMANRTFTLKHLERIRTVLPEAYTYAACRAVSEDGERRVNSVCLEMVNLENESDGKEIDGIPVEGDENRREEQTNGRETELKTYRPWGNQLVKRRIKFHNRLVELVKLEHSKFLKTLPYEIKDDPENLTAWHSDFKLDNVPEVEPTPMPQLQRYVSKMEQMDAKAKAERDAERAKDAQPIQSGTLDVKEKEKVEVIEGKVEGAVQGDKNGTEVKGELQATMINTSVKKDAENVEVIIATPVEKKPLSRAAALLERIRLKERKQKEEEIYRPKLKPEEIRKNAMLSRLPDLGQAIAFLFSSSQKKAIPLKEVGDHLITAAKNPLSHSEACDHVRLLSEVCPEWCKVIKLTAGAVVRLEQVPSRLQKLKERVAALLKPK